jgi:hypothetical protein
MQICSVFVDCDGMVCFFAASHATMQKQNEKERKRRIIMPQRLSFYSLDSLLSSRFIFYSTHF